MVKYGGKRKGAGRHPKEPTVVIRIPVSLVEKVKAMKASLNPSQV